MSRANQAAMLQFGFPYSAWDPAFNGSMAYSNKNLTVNNNSSGTNRVRSLVSKSTGKYYVEIVIDTKVTNQPAPGFAIGSWSGGSQAAHFWEIDSTPGYFKETVFTSGTVTTYVNGDIITMAIDITAGSIWWGKNNTWFQGNPASNTSPLMSGITFGAAVYVAVYQNGAACQSTLHATPNVQAYAAPAGFGAWTA